MPQEKKTAECNTLEGVIKYIKCLATCVFISKMLLNKFHTWLSLIIEMVHKNLPAK